MNDIVGRLRRSYGFGAALEAADRIEELERDLEEVVASHGEMARKAYHSRREALEEAAKIAVQKVKDRVGVPCPDGIKGCLVFHFKEVERAATPLEIAAAIRALMEPKDE